MIFFNWKYIQYTLKHKRAFLRVEKQLKGRNTLRGFLHDVDKLIMYCILPKALASKIHGMFSKHHANKATTESDFEQMAYDWECARFTKPDKLLNAKDTLYKYYPRLEDKMVPILKKFKLM